MTPAEHIEMSMVGLQEEMQPYGQELRAQGALPAPRHWSRALSRPGTAVVIVELGALLRLLFLTLYVQQPIRGDAAGYNDMALLLLKGDAFIPFWPPGVPLYL